MKWTFVCLLFICQLSNAKSLSVIQWIDAFALEGVQIFYSSDYLSSTDKQIILDIEPATVTNLNLALHSISLILVEIDAQSFVVKPIVKDTISYSGMLVKAFNKENNKPIHSFSVISDNKKYSAENYVVLVNSVQQQVELLVNAQGYYPQNHIIKGTQGKYTVFNVWLDPKPVSIDKIIVTASRINFQSPQASKTALMREDIENAMPLGNDPVRVSSSIAGTVGNGVSGKSRTRGGTEDESLIILDNHALRDPFHFKDFYSLFSTINLSVIEGLDFYSGVFPMQYGGRLSSVMDITTGDNFNQSNHEFGVDFFSTYYTYRHSNANYSKQFQTSLRSGGLFINDRIIKNNIIQPEFDDAYFKTFQQINDKWSASQHLLLSRDEIRVNDLINDKGERADSGSHDQNLWLQWHYNNADTSQVSFQIYTTRKHDRRSGFVANTETRGNLSEDVLSRYSGIKYQHKYNFNNRFSLKFGLDVYQENTTIHSIRNINHFGELAQQLELVRQDSLFFDLKKQGNAAEFFINNRYQYSDKLIFDVGARFEYKQWIDENIFSPRFNLSYFHNDSTTYRFALGRHQQSQYLDELLLEDESPEYFKPTSADIAVFEFNKQLKENLNIRAEIYYKKYSSTHPYYENLFNGLHVLPDLFFDRIKISPDDTTASGIELSLSGDKNDINWSASYAFSDVDDFIESNEVPRSWDQHNALKFNLHMPIHFKYFPNWGLDFAANYHNGWAKTEIVTNDNGFEIGERNQATFDDFYQFDIKLSKLMQVDNGHMLFSIQINNILNTHNPCCVEYELIDGQLHSDEKRWLPMSPNISFIYKWN